MQRKWFRRSAPAAALAEDDAGFGPACWRKMVRAAGPPRLGAMVEARLPADQLVAAPKLMATAGAQLVISSVAFVGRGLLGHGSPMKVLVADKISPKGVQLLRNQPGFEVIEAYNSPREKLLELVKDVHAIAVRSETKITAEIIAGAPKLQVVGRAGVGVDNVDVEAATERGVVVMNTPSGNTIATAELTFTHMLCGARPVPQAAASMRAGQWDRKSFSGIELFRKTLGIVGLGRIGSEVARRAQAFGMRVVAFDPYLAPSRAKGMQIDSVTLDELLAQYD